MRCSNALRSPFLERAVTVSRKLTPDERVMYYWLMNTHHGNEEQIIYNDRVVEVMLLEFCSLLPHHEVSSGVISSFCSVLNHMEDLKSVTSPKRLFFTTYPALYTVVMSNGRDDDADKLDEFASNIDKEVSEIPHFAWGDIDMVFFAFCVSKRYYTVCFCFKRRSVVIIDACKDGENNDLRFTYGCIPEALRTFFCKYLSRIGCHNQCKSVINVPIQRMKMSWRTTDNAEDSGVYLLRHLEVYMGEREGQWNCGLTTKNKGVLQFLRAKYNRVLMLAGINHSALLNKDAAYKHFAKENKKTKINVEHMIANYGSVQMYIA
ncbi:uncharacterized protein LOC121802902 [Salvia splendens]|uniref:uncharacterized protein LOC121802902 n=1 Tax=Salvia splendens TaxID=180675 RepID=UPI001C278DAE|nr:uncharacterized protein LOC121802902 [Salvia splendens]